MTVTVVRLFLQKVQIPGSMVDFRPMNDRTLDYADLFPHFLQLETQSDSVNAVTAVGHAHSNVSAIKFEDTVTYECHDGYSLGGTVDGTVDALFLPICPLQSLSSPAVAYTRIFRRSRAVLLARITEVLLDRSHHCATLWSHVHVSVRFAMATAIRGQRWPNPRPRGHLKKLCLEVDLCAYLGRLISHTICGW